MLKRNIGKTRRCDGPDLLFDSCQHSHEFLPCLVIGFSLARCGARKMIIRDTPVCHLCLFGPCMTYLIRRPLFVVRSASLEMQVVFIPSALCRKPNFDVERLRKGPRPRNVLVRNRLLRVQWWGVMCCHTLKGILSCTSELVGVHLK